MLKERYKEVMRKFMEERFYIVPYAYLYSDREHYKIRLRDKFYIARYYIFDKWAEIYYNPSSKSIINILIKCGLGELIEKELKLMNVWKDPTAASFL